MSINELELTAPVLHGLFSNNLVMIPGAGKHKTEQAASPAGIRILGSNGRHICLLVRSANHAFLPEHHLQFLTKMLEACKMNLGDVAIINVAQTPVNITNLRAHCAPTCVLLFGVATADLQLPFEFPAFKIQIHDQCSFLWVPDLDELNQDSEAGKLLKSKLWVCLRKLFAV